MDKTKETLAKLSANPCSVIIVGFGEEEFENMKVLDGDGPNKLPGAERDIVQFVTFSDAIVKGDLGE